MKLSQEPRTIGTFAYNPKTGEETYVPTKKYNSDNNSK